ncbi:sporulation integral membrane protein YtvI [Alteribacter natronophilus]|uniref:sporulation integral membrane protein YtvI n=1 Tax=Alteribacter natronophilus TaxID=2583810 RepID=UPI00110E4D4B|nr:sporulation integral membrane protein YtvI [Alteribacter natronophilus]TMW70694.1 sporulation integral membrane protein YtvI [Alteribacter natronophilus]
MTKQQVYVLLRLIGFAAVLLGSLWLLGQVVRLTYPFIIAAVLVWPLLPLVRLLRNKLRFPNGLAVLVALLVGVTTVAGLFTGLTFLAILGIQQITKYAPGWFETAAVHMQEFFNDTVLPMWNEITGVVSNLTPEQQQALHESITGLGTQAGEVLGQFGQRLADALRQLLIAVPSSIIIILFILLSFYFIGKDWGTIRRGVVAFFSAGILRKMRMFGAAFRIRVFGFLRAQLILMALTSVIVLIGLTIIGVDQAVTLAIVVGIAEILPYLGSGTILIPWAIYLFIVGDLTLAIGVSIVYAVTLIARQSLEPKILSSSMNLHPLAVLVSLFAGFQLFGAFGLFLGPLILVVLVILKDIGALSDLKQFIVHGFKEENGEDKR